MRWLVRKIKGIGSWIAHLPVVAKVVLGTLLVVVIFGGSYGSYRMYDYTQNDPEFCRSCHTMEVAWTKWSNSEHSKVACHSCHTVSPIGGAQLVVNYLMERPDRNTNHAAVSDKACEKCHYSGDPQWVQVENTAGHKTHAEGQNIACQTCHGMRLHSFRPSTEICAACHADHVAGQEKAIKVEQMRDMHCTECHPFLREDSPLRPTRETCLSCHQKLPNTGVVFPDNAPMKWDCRECHKPHDQARPVVDCLSCHTDAKTNGLHGKTTHSQQTCKTCHQPHKWTVTTREPCLTCHQDKVNHNPGGVCADCHDYKTLAPPAGNGQSLDQQAQSGSGTGTTGTPHDGAQT
ncbi:MAG: NapC/NirT family cytochrome c [Thermoleophilia bacterium]